MPRPHCDLFGPIFTVKATVSLVSRVRCYHSWTHNSRESSFSLGTGAMTQPLLCPHTSPAKVQRVAQGESRPPERARVCVCGHQHRLLQTGTLALAELTHTLTRTHRHTRISWASMHARTHAHKHTAQKGALQQAARTCSRVMSLDRPFIIT